MFNVLLSLICQILDTDNFTSIYRRVHNTMHIYHKPAKTKCVDECMTPYTNWVYTIGTFCTSMQGTFYYYYSQEETTHVTTS